MNEEDFNSALEQILLLATAIMDVPLVEFINRAQVPGMSLKTYAAKDLAILMLDVASTMQSRLEDAGFGD